MPDLLVLPADAIPELPRRGIFGVVPTFMYGSRALLTAAFLFGCVDYLRDPWTPEEFWARAGRWVDKVRIRAPWGEIRLRGPLMVGPAGERLLTAAERTVFRLLAAVPGSVVAREDMLLALRYPGARGSRTADVHVGRLRAKLRNVLPAGVPDVITTVHRRGYCLSI